MSEKAKEIMQDRLVGVNEALKAINGHLDTLHLLSDTLDHDLFPDEISVDVITLSGLISEGKYDDALSLSNKMLNK